MPAWLNYIKRTNKIENVNIDSVGVASSNEHSTLPNTTDDEGCTEKNKIHTHAPHCVAPWFSFFWFVVFYFVIFLLLFTLPLVISTVRFEAEIDCEPKISLKSKRGTISADKINDVLLIGALYLVPGILSIVLNIYGVIYLCLYDYICEYMATSPSGLHTYRVLSIQIRIFW